MNPAAEAGTSSGAGGDEDLLSLALSISHPTQRGSGPRSLPPPQQPPPSSSHRQDLFSFPIILQGPPPSSLIPRPPPPPLLQPVVLPGRENLTLGPSWSNRRNSSPPPLSSSPPFSLMPPPSFYPQPLLLQRPTQQNLSRPQATRAPRARRDPAQSLEPGKSEFVEPPFPWATNRRATVHSLEYLLANGIETVTGEMQCRRCDDRVTVEYDIREKFAELLMFAGSQCLRNRAPGKWTIPEFPACDACGPKNMRPVMARKKRELNWLFLLLGQMLGYCNLKQLKYFCKHTSNHRTGAKDRVLYSTYLGLSRQLDPNTPFDL